MKTSAIGDVGPDGSFHLMTAKPNDGASAGKYKVMIQELRASAGGSQMAPTKAHVKYNAPGTTDLEAVVEPVGKQKLVLKVERAK